MTVDRAKKRPWLRALCAPTLALCGFLLATRGSAEQGELLRYEPPPPEYVYPPGLDDAEAPNDATPADAGVAEAPLPADAGGARQGGDAQVAGDAGALPSTAPDATVVDAGGQEPSADGGAPETYGARARVKSAPPRGSRVIAMRSARDLPGAFGDPLRVLEALPGVVPLTSGLPYAYIRGAPPLTQGFIYDDIPLPQLFHAALGPAVLHPRATGSVRLDAGIPEARFGRRLGGVLLAEGSPLESKLVGELELRLLDLGGFVQTPVGEGQLQVSGRIGYPQLALAIAQGMGVVDDDTSANYANGQVRFRYPLSQRDHFELVWLSAFDKVDLPGLSNDPRAGASKMQFQRLETRVVRNLGKAELGTALRFGFDNSELGTALTVRSFNFGPRLWAKLLVGEHVLRFGAEIYGSRGDVINGPGAIASPDGDVRIHLPPIAEAAARNQGGVFAQGNFRLGPDTLLMAGLRLDYWGVESKVDIAVDPRVRLSHDITSKLSVHGAVGMTHQPAVFLLPTPGLSDVALDRGLMRGIHSELGSGYQLTRSTRVDVQGFYHRYDRLLLPELVQDGIVPEDPPLVSSNVYGLEAFLMRDLTEEVSGWIAYTLTFADADSGPVVGKFKPDYDVRHVVNAVISWRIWRGLILGGRMQTRSGRVVEQLNANYTQRLPWFTRVDARVGYTWRGRFADMTAYLEWLNLFLRQEYTDADCLLQQCNAKAAPVIAVPNLGIRAEF
jgi:hypothetical protein